MTSGKDRLQQRNDSAYCDEGQSEEGVSVLVATLSKIRLGRVTGPRAAWRFEPVPEGSYALILPLADEQRSALQAARVGAAGLLYELDPDDKTSRESDVVLYLLAPERYRVWWTQDEGRYAAALEDLRPLFEEGSIIAVQQYLEHDRAPLREQVRELGADDKLNHVICHHLLHRHLFHEGPGSPIFDVTPEPIRALFTVELMQWYLLQATEASANDMATFEHVAAMIHAADKGLTDATLERSAATLFRGAEERRVFESFRDYTWRCAATGTSLVLFARSIQMHAGPSDLPQGGVPDASDGGVPAAPEDDWTDAAALIRRQSEGKKNGPAVHPYFQNVTGRSRGFVREGVVLEPDQQQLLMSYFESYRFGGALRTTTIDGTNGFVGPDHYRGRMAARLDDWRERQAAIRSRARQLLERHAGAEASFVAVACGYADREDLHGRYAEASAFCEHRWWTALREAEHKAAPGQNPDQSYSTSAWPFWKSFKARTALLGASTRGAGKVCKLLRERVAAYDLSLTQAREMLDTVARLEISLEGGEVDALRHVIRTENTLVLLEASGQAGEVRLTFGSERPRGAPAEINLRFIRSSPVTDGADRSGSPSSATGHARNWRPAPQVGKYQVVVPAELAALREAGRFPEAFTLLADTVNVAIAVATVTDKVDLKEKALATFELARGLVGIITSFPTAAMALAPKLESSELLQGAARGGKRLGGLSTWLSRIDGVTRIYKGLDVLFDHGAQADYERRHGREFRAELQRWNDVANVVAGVVSAAELTGSAIAAAGTTQMLGFSTALLAGFSATPWGLCIVVAGSIIVAGSALLLEMTEPDARLAQVERSLDEACAREIRATRFKASVRLDDLVRAVSNSWSDG